MFNVGVGVGVGVAVGAGDVGVGVGVGVDVLVGVGVGVAVGVMIALQVTVCADVQSLEINSHTFLICTVYELPVVKPVITKGDEPEYGITVAVLILPVLTTYLYS